MNLVIPSSSELVASVETAGYLPPTADHIKQVTTLVGPVRDSISMEEVPDWSKADYGAIRSALEIINWEEEFRDKQGQECLDPFYEVIQRETERCIPKKLRRRSNRPMWMSKNIMRLLRKKRRIWRNYTSDEYYRQEEPQAVLFLPEEENFKQSFCRSS